MTAPLTAEERAEVVKRSIDATQHTHLNLTAAHRAAFVSALDVPDLLAPLDAAEERAQAAEGALARVEALADEWDEIADAWPYAHWHDSQKANAHSVRAAMEGKP